MEKQQIARKNMYMSQEIATWYEEESQRLGITQSSLMTMVLSQYIDQKKALGMGDILERLQKQLEDK